MKQGRILSAVLSTAMIFGLSVPAFANDLDGKLVVLHTNDIHGYYDTTETSIGIAGVVGLREYYEAQGADVILLDAGDFSQGTTLVNHEKGIKSAQYLAAAEYDAVTLGNHEFDFGFEAVKKNAAYLKEAGVPVLDANILKKGTDTPYFDDNMVIETEGLKVGVFGLDTPETQTKSSPSSVKELTFLDEKAMFDCAQKQVETLQAEGCEYIIALTHLGVDDESKGRRSIDLAENVKGIDLIVDGHSHTEMNGGQMVGETMIVSTGCYLKNMGTVVVDKQTQQETAKLVSVADFAKAYKYDETLKKQVADDKAEIDKYYNGIFATSKVDLNGKKEPGVRTEETNLGDFTADAYLYAAKEYVKSEGLDLQVDIALSNGGGIRASIPKGEISMNTLYTVFPYGNSLVLVTVTGEQLLEILEASTFATPTAIGGFPQIAGASYTINTAVEYVNGEQYPNSTYFAPANPGSRVTINEVGGKPFDPNANYTVAVNAFQAEGGDTYYALTQGSYIQDTGLTDAEVLISYVKSMNNVIDETYAQSQGRIKIVSETVAKPETETPAEKPEKPATPEQKPEVPMKDVTEAKPVQKPVEQTEVSPSKLYTVVAGDNLWKIAKKELGDGTKWINIYEDNKSQIANPNQISIGQKLVINKAA